jgi:uncharacterized damage-inducible protein DinB
LLLALTGCALCSPAMFAADAKALANHWKTAKEYTIEMARLMPAESYSFKPSPDEMSFAEQMVHITMGNAYVYAGLVDGKPALAKPANMEKETILKLLGDSFEQGEKTISGMSDEQLRAVHKSEDGSETGEEIIVSGLNHITHHRGQTVVYLRLKGIKPAEYRY